MTQRTERIDELLRQEIGALLAKEVADPAIGFVTVTRVETSPDLSHARVWVSLIGQRAERSASLAALRRAMPFVRHQLNDRIRLRRIPDLHVDLDDTSQRGTRVLQILHELEEGRTPDDLPTTAETLPTPTARIHSGEEGGEADGLGAAALPLPTRRRRRTGGLPTGSGRSGPRPGASGGRDGQGGSSGAKGGHKPGSRRPK
jgi:ribosome-binding factor A